VSKRIVRTFLKVTALGGVCLELGRSKMLPWRCLSRRSCGGEGEGLIARRVPARLPAQKQRRHSTLDAESVALVQTRVERHRCIESEQGIMSAVMPRKTPFAGIAVLAVSALAAGCHSSGRAFNATEATATVQRYCSDCHNPDDLAGGLSFRGVDAAHVGVAPQIWEKVIRKLRVGMMPPIDATSLPADRRTAMVAWLEKELDAAAREAPDPGPALLRRLNRTEYGNAIRDLLHLDVDVTTLLPPDDSAYGFDNVADALGTSPLLVEQYLSAAGKIASLAVGEPDVGASAQTFRIRQDESQNVQAIGMPLGTVGGGVVHVVLPLDGEYRLGVTFFKSNLGAMKGLELPHDVEIAVDGERVHVATIGGPEDFTALMRNITEAANAVEARSSAVVPLTAGPHDISVGFLYQGAVQGSERLEPYVRSSQDILDATGHPHIETLVITGPYQATGPGDTPSRKRIFVCRPEVATWPTSTDGESAQRDCARDVLSALVRRAYRGTASARDVDGLMAFYEQGRAERGFEGGIQTAIERVLASPKFLFRVEHDEDDLAAGAVHRVADAELASRLSFFLWSSIPDDELLDVAARQQLHDPKVLKAQVLRMLADPKAHALVDNFAGQWLYLRNLASFVPNSATFPNFDDNLRQGFLKETQLFFESVVREDRNVLDLLTANYTYLNERVAKHYGISGVYGNHFRSVTLDDETRWGLLG
jgi:hypothetical protein